MMPVDPDSEGQDVEQAATAASETGYDLETPEPAAPLTWSPANLSDAQVLKAMGKHPMSLMSPDFAAQANAFRDAVGKQQALQLRQQQDDQKRMAADAKRYNAMGAEMEKKSDPSFVAQQAYGRLGNIGAARVIAKSSGPALFQHGEEVNLGKSGKFYVAPAGYLMLPGPDGQSQRFDAEQVIQAAGVSVVPFLGGDEGAVEFRRTMGRAMSVTTMLDELEDLYEKGASMPISERKTKASQIESQLPTLISQLRSGSNSSAGISDYETKAIEDSLPRGSDLLSLNDNQRTKLLMVREQLRRIILDRGRRNGIEFRQVITNSGNAGAQPQASGRTNTPLGITTNGTR